MERIADVLYAKGGLMYTGQKLREATHGFLESEKISMSHAANVLFLCIPKD